jgi:hypothetical protein
MRKHLINNLPTLRKPRTDLIVVETLDALFPQLLHVFKIV